MVNIDKKSCNIENQGIQMGICFHSFAPKLLSLPQLRPDKKCAHLEEVVEVVLEVLSPNQSCMTSLQQCSRPIRAALESLLLHYFSPYRMNRHMEDMMWFLIWANQQEQWCADKLKDTDSVYEQSIGVVAGMLEDDLLEKSVVQDALRAEVRKTAW